MQTTEKFTSPLDYVRIPAPCPASWDDMDGDERVRHCRECKLNVYNLSGMHKSEAEALIQKSEGRLCVRFYQREDGTIITDNCPVGVRMLRRKLAWVAAGIAAGFFFAASGALAMWGKVSGTSSGDSAEQKDLGRAPIEKLTQWINPPVPTGKLMPMAGAMCPMPPPPPNNVPPPVPAPNPPPQKEVPNEPPSDPGPPEVAPK